MKADYIDVLFEDFQPTPTKVVVQQVLSSLQAGLFPKLVQVSNVLHATPITMPVQQLLVSDLVRLLDQHSAKGHPLLMEFEGGFRSVVIYGSQRIIGLGLKVDPEIFPAQSVLEWFKGMCANWKPSIAHAVLRFTSESISDRHFRYKSPLPDGGILSWLHYFDADKMRSQGLQFLLDYPAISNYPVARGTLFQLFGNPFESQTQEGESRIVAANEFLLAQQ